MQLLVVDPRDARHSQQPGCHNGGPPAMREPAV